MVSAIKLLNVSKSYGKTVALDKISLEIEGNTIVCIAGPNGSGKTTLLDIISGTIKPTFGSVIVSGSVGYCHQSPRVWQDLPVRDNLDLFMELYGAGRGWVEKLVGLAGLREWLDVKVEELSYGTRKRVELIISLLPDSRILALDEPTTGLDSESVEYMLSFVREFKGKRTIIIATHQLKDLNGLCDYMFILRNGRLAYETKINSGMNLAEIYANEKMESGQH